MTNKTITQGIQQIGLTVPNLSETRDFFLATLGFTQCGEIPDYPAVCLTDGITVITLWQALEPNVAIAFDQKNVIGLHHVAFNVEGPEALGAFHDKLKTTDGVEIEVAPETLSTGPVTRMICTIPSGIRLEFVTAEAS